MRRVLLDEMLPWQLKRSLREEARTVQDMGWAGIKNGKLLRLVEKEFDVMITVDKGFEHQQHLAGFDLAFILLRANTTKLRDLAPLFGEAQQQIDLVQTGQVHVIGNPPGRRRSR